jgi:unsaturated rhamnogalacturonyl hydrolase
MKATVSILLGVTFALAASAGRAGAATTTRFLQAEGAANAVDCGAGFATAGPAGSTGGKISVCRADTSSFIQWIAIVPDIVPVAATRTLRFRYANPGATDRTAEVTVNDIIISGALSFPGTGSATSWSSASVTAALNPGENVIRLRGTVTGVGLANIDRLDLIDPPGPPDWAVALAESTMLRSPLPVDLGPWEYSRALVLHGMYLLYKRTGDPRYLAYLQAWVDAHVNGSGSIVNDTGGSQSLNSLDNLLPGNVVLDAWIESKDPNKGQASNRYRRALQTIRNRFTDASNSSGGGPSWTSKYPRTSDQGFFHNTGAIGQLWLDGVFMGQKFLVRYGNQFGDSTYASNEATTQLLVQHGHLKDSVTGLLWHAYDEQGDPTWPLAPGTKHSQEFWGRAMGWYGMTMVETLATLPLGHPSYQPLLAALQGLIAAWKNFQDPATGRWFQIVNKGSDPQNWNETSCSSMYAYVIARSIALGYVPAATYQAVATSGYNGVLGKISFGSDAALDAELTNLVDVSQGTNIGDEAYYFARQRPVNDRHGLGSFLIMYDQFNPGVPPQTPPPPLAPSGLTATPGPGQVSLSWTGPAGATSFTVKRSTTQGGGYTPVSGGSGFASTSYTDTTVSGGVTYYYVVTASNSGGEGGPSGEAFATPPAGWSHNDVGAVGAAGSFSQTGATLTVKGSGADIYGALDEFHFVYRSVTGDATIVARVTSIQNTNVWAKAGVMMRTSGASSASNAANVFALVPASAANKYRFQTRATAGGSSSSLPSGGTGAGTTPVWLRVVRRGNTFTGSYSPDGNSWTLLSSSTVTMPATITAGLAVTSHNDGTVATGVFDSVSITTP